MVAEDTEELYDDLYEDFGGGKQFLKTSLQEVTIFVVPLDEHHWSIKWECIHWPSDSQYLQP